MMSSSWPPTPTVEDEEAALARENGLDSVALPTHGDEEPQARGTVDQNPIILDVHSPTPHQHSSKIEPVTERSSSGDSYGPATPTSAASEQRFVLLDHNNREKASSEEQPQLPRLRSTDNFISEHSCRGRPYLSPVRTNVGNGADEMVTNRQRSPSQYCAGLKSCLKSSQPQDRFSEEFFPLPRHTFPDQYIAASAGPRVQHENNGSLSHSERPLHTLSQHSRSGRQSGIRPAQPSLEELAPIASGRCSMSYTPATASIASTLSSNIHRQARNQPTTIEGAQHTRVYESFRYPPTAEDKTRRDRSRSRHRSKPRRRIDRSKSGESPHTSSAEESKDRTHPRYRLPAQEGRLSRRGSTDVPEVPRLDVSNQRHSYWADDLVENRRESSKGRSPPSKYPPSANSTRSQPLSAQSPQAMEDYLDKALRSHSNRSSYIPQAAPNSPTFTSASPIASQTPRRNGASEELFDCEFGAVQGAPSSRRPSADDTPGDVLRPLNHVVAAAADNSTMPATVPALSRSSVAPINTYLDNSSKKTPSSRQNSRRPSPVLKNVSHPVCRANSFDMRDDRLPARAATSISNEQRHSRASTTVAEASLGNQYAPSSRHGFVDLEAGQPFARAYSTTGDGIARPTPAYRAMSSSQAQPSHTAEPWRPLPRQRTSSSTYISPTNANLSSTYTHSAARPMTFTPVPVQGPPAPPPIHEPESIDIPPCPRSHSVVGLSDWYTISHVADINICPTCMARLGSSRFRDIFVPSLPNFSKETRCAMSQPWLRIAFVQAVKQRRSTLEMVNIFQHLIHVPENIWPCKGRESEMRKWYHVIDPYDGLIVPGFEICSHCASNVDVVFPQLAGTFKRTSSLLQDRVCSLNTQSRRFLSYIEQLDRAASRFEKDKSVKKPDIQELARYARRVANIQACPRDKMLLKTEWHFMPQLPEFTVCAECFEDVVRPLYDKPLAKAIAWKAKSVPASQVHRFVPAGATSCQLYSPRMRKIFHDAVHNNDFDKLKEAAVDRHDAEIRCLAKYKKLLQESNAGLDCTAEMRRNLQTWRIWE